MRTFVLENLGRMDDFARAYAQYVGVTTVKTLCGEPKRSVGGSREL
ncbi:MAG: hypothetical protein L2C94_004240 [Aigarchaeota archaeon]|nr:hypothetical protein [Candidatus Wolframiiraptor gerlachensis]